MNEYILKQGSKWHFCIPLRVNRWSRLGWRQRQGSHHLGPSDSAQGWKHHYLGPGSLGSALAGKLCSEWTKVARNQQSNHFCEAK